MPTKFLEGTRIISEALTTARVSKGAGVDCGSTGFLVDKTISPQPPHQNTKLYTREPWSKPMSGTYARNIRWSSMQLT